MEEDLKDHPYAFLRLSRLRRIVGDGRTSLPMRGVCGVAEFLDISPGSVRSLLDLLEGYGYITWTVDDWSNYRITVLPPEELITARVAQQERERSARDRSLLTPKLPRSPPRCQILAPGCDHAVIA